MKIYLTSGAAVYACTHNGSNREGVVSYRLGPALFSLIWSLSGNGPISYALHLSPFRTHHKTLWYELRTHQIILIIGTTALSE